VDREEPAETNRRVSNARVKAMLGWHPQFASYREGLAASDL
jgi:hypothetical protein